MRKIKFRIWDGKKFLAGRDLDDICLSLDGEPLIREGQELNLLEDNYVVQQFTGLKDVNGKEIYEGDIMETIIPEISIIEGKEIENKNSGRRVGTVIFGGRSYRQGSFSVTSNMDLAKSKVISNIFKNPELL